MTTRRIAVATGYPPGESREPHPECICGSKHYECGRYRCSLCLRTRPWCLGSDDEYERLYGPVCDDCWVVVRDWAESGLTLLGARERIAAIGKGASR